MAPLDWIDRLLSSPFREARRLPPNRFRIRVGVGNRVLFNQFHHLLLPINFWFHVFSRGYASFDSQILDIGCGCGRFAMPLRDYDLYDSRFTGRYTGLDLDREMIDWCRRHFDQRFDFVCLNHYSRVYNPTGERGAPVIFPVEDDSQDFVFAISLLTHLLPSDLEQYLRETWRVLKPGAVMTMSVFCIDFLDERLRQRWSFPYRQGAAYLQSQRYPEAAVAYEKRYLLDVCSSIGYGGVQLRPGPGQALLVAKKPVSARAAFLAGPAEPTQSEIDSDFWSEEQRATPLRSPAAPAALDTD